MPEQLQVLANLSGFTPFGTKDAPQQGQVIENL